MAFPTINGAPTQTLTFDGSAGTAHVINLPATLVSGDLILVFFGICQTATALSIGGSFTEKHESANGARIGVFAKISDGTEDGGTVTVTSTGSTAGMGCVYRIDAGSWAGDLAKVYVSTGASGTGVNPEPDNLAPGVGALDFLWFAAGVTENTNTWSTPPTDFTNITSQEVEDTPNDDGSMGTARRSVNASSLNPNAFVVSDPENYRAITVAVEPAGAGGGVTPTGDYLNLENGTDFYLLENGTDWYWLEDQQANPRRPPNPGYIGR